MLRLFVVFLFLPLLSSPATAGIGDPLITYQLAYTGPETLCLLVVPDGSGPPLDRARTPWGGIADATILVEILDVAGLPVEGYPPEDVWMTSADEGLRSCRGGFIADGPTDAQGHTVFTRPPRAGGWSTASARLVVNGWVVTTSPGLDLAFNGPDLNGDLAVNLSDVALFASDFFAPVYSHRADLQFDGTVNLADIVPLADAFGATCP